MPELEEKTIVADSEKEVISPVEDEKKAADETTQPTEPVDYESLSQEELEKVDLNKLAIDESKEVEEKESIKPDDKKPEETTPPDNDDKEIDYKKRFKDTQKSYTKSQMELAEEKKRNRELEDKQFNSIEELSEDELDALKDVDPDAYIEYKESVKEKESITESRKQKDNAELYDKQVGEIKSFAKDLGVENDGLTEFFEGDKFKQIDKYLSPIRRDGQIFTAKEIKRAHDFLFIDDVISARVDNAIEKARTDQLAGFEKAANGGSVLDKIPGAESAKTLSSDLTMGDIDAMSDDQADKYLTELRQSQG